MITNHLVTAIVDALFEERIPFALRGWFAANLYGAPYLTMSEEFVVRPCGDELSALGSRLSAQFRFQPQAGIESAEQSSHYLLRHRDTPLRAQLFRLTDDAHDRAQLERRVRVDAWSRPVFIPAAEDLIISKLRGSRHGNRAKDLDDGRGLIEIQKSRLDWDYIDRRCEQHGTKPILDQVRRGALDA